MIAATEDPGTLEDHLEADHGDAPSIEDLHSKTESEDAVDTSADSTSAAGAVEDGTTPHAPTDAAPVATRPQRPRSDLLRQLDQAPLRLRSFGTRGVWLGERQIWPSAEAVEETGWELVVLLGIHPVAGVQVETLADMIWDEETPDDPGTVLRKRRRRLRNELKRLVPELEADPLPTDPKGRVYRLDPGVVASDMQQFVELAAWAKSLPREDAIAAYEEALALYQGDLLDSVTVPTYSWLYDGAALATSLRPEYNRLQQEVQHRLADLYAASTDDRDLGRAMELYTELTAERPDEDRLWVSLLRVQGRRGDALGLQASLRRLRTALVELGQGDDPDTVPLPFKVQQILDEVQAQARASGKRAAG